MIENYDKVVEEWGCAQTAMMDINPDEDLRRWCVQKTVTILANADYYYTKKEVDDLLNKIDISGITREEAEEMINEAVASKADQSDLEALSAQVASNTAAILNTYNKQETNALLDSYLTKLKANEMFANYTKVEGTTLVLNSQNITI